MQVTPAVVSVSRALGALLVGLGIMNWMARNVVDIASGVVNGGAWFGEVVHVLLAIGFLYYLLARRPEPA